MPSGLNVTKDKLREYGEKHGFDVLRRALAHFHRGMLNAYGKGELREHLWRAWSEGIKGWDSFTDDELIDRVWGLMVVDLHYRDSAWTDFRSQQLDPHMQSGSTSEEQE